MLPSGTRNEKGLFRVPPVAWPDIYFYCFFASRCFLRVSSTSFRKTRVASLMFLGHIAADTPRRE